ncbi:hypothetical protein D5086_009517 [Populus alba]|uniref:Uncharacterized protein n=1 Tax=Populus alba TaxID=43335 RepID=A0ACC4CJ62_POPAL
MALVFSKFLTADDIENGLCIPGCSLGPLPFEEGQSMNMHVHDGNGQEWIFSCTIRRNQSMGHFLSVRVLEEFYRSRRKDTGPVSEFRAVKDLILSFYESANDGVSGDVKFVNFNAHSF